jgi:hypothetical protein
MIYVFFTSLNYLALQPLIQPIDSKNGRGSYDAPAVATVTTG